MVDIVKKEEPKKEESRGRELPDNNTVITSTPQVKPDDVDVEHDAAPQGGTIETVPVTPRKKKDDPLEEIRAAQASVEAALETERAKRIAAERERDTARSQVENTRATLSKSEAEKIAAQEAAVASRMDSAKTAVENAERALEEAIDTGKPAKEQINLQKKLAEAVYTLKGAESAKSHFDNWKEKEKNKPAVVVKTADDGLTDKSRKWINDHPRYATDKQYRRAAIAAHEDAVEDGISVDSDEYFNRINEAVSLFEKDGAATVTQRKAASGTSTAAPVNHDSTAAGARGGTAAEEQRTGRRTFRLDPAMRQMAIQTYGKNSSHKLSDDEAYKRYAAKQLEIRDRRAAGEHI